MIWLNDKELRYISKETLENIIALNNNKEVILEVEDFKEFFDLKITEFSNANELIKMDGILDDLNNDPKEPLKIIIALIELKKIKKIKYLK
jgi:hypothetical protein